jgi:hypothetical protein
VGLVVLRGVPILAGLALLVIELTHLAEGNDASVEFLLLGVGLVALGCLPRRTFEHTIGAMIEKAIGGEQPDKPEAPGPSQAGATRPRAAGEQSVARVLAEGGAALKPSAGGERAAAVDPHEAPRPSSGHVQADVDVRLEAICAAIRSPDPGEQEHGLDAGVAAWPELDAGARRQLVALAGSVKRRGGDAGSRARRGARIVELEALEANG